MVHAQAVVTALGANTSLGDAVTACAAARARLSRPAPLERAVVDEDGEELSVVGHPVPTVRGFQGQARLLSLAIPALEDLVSGAALEPREPVGLLLALPDQAARAAAAGQEAPRPFPLAERLLAFAKLQVAPQHRRTFAIGHAGFGLALQAALELLGRRELSACIVGGVDTLLDDPALDALLAECRLKTPDNAAGLQPGEAAAFVLLETPEHAHRRKAAPLAGVTAIGSARDKPLLGADPPLGSGLATAIAGLANGAAPCPGFFVLDRNGEAVRANDWGHCLARLAAAKSALAHAPAWDPAVSFGDTGAASGALAAHLAIRAFARGYAPAASATLVSSSDGGARTAVRLDKAS